MKALCTHTFLQKYHYTDQTDWYECGSVYEMSGDDFAQQWFHILPEDYDDKLLFKLALQYGITITDAKD